jgi:hypothetical protein
MTKAEANCIHYWVLDCHDLGICRKCAAVKNFRELREIARLYQAAKVAAARACNKLTASNKRNT